MQVTLPYSRETFTASLQENLKVAMAAAASTGCACAISKMDVKITIIESGGSRRSLHTSSIAVDVSIAVPSEEAGNKILEGDHLSKDAINKELDRQGVESILEVLSSPALKSGGGTMESGGGTQVTTPSPAGEGERAGGGATAGIVAAVVALFTMAAAAWFYIFTRRKRGPVLDQHVTSAEMAAEMAAIIAMWQEVGDSNDKFTASKLSMGNPSDSDLRNMLGLDDKNEFGIGMQNPMEAMKQEWDQHGSEKDKANFRYVLEGRACDPAWVPQHVKESLASGNYHGGSLTAADFDTGHDGWGLKEFCDLPSSQAAGLGPEHVLALRLYSSDSFRLFNTGMRLKTKPHPIRFTMYVLNEALKKLRKVVAISDPNEYNKIKRLFRGMKDMTLDFEVFKTMGGTELAPMSTTDDEAVANSYAASRRGLIFEYETQGNSRGVDISDFSMYPKEREFLYPPLTYLILDVNKPLKRLENGTIVVPIIPQMA
jgi:hypothetical protein